MVRLLDHSDRSNGLIRQMDHRVGVINIIGGRVVVVS